MGAQDGASGTAIAELKTLFRVVNEEIEGVHESLGADHPEFLCECGRDECCARLAMSIEEYESVRSVPTRFAVAPGHEWPGVESVVATNPRFSVVETQAEEVARLSIARDPRRGTRTRRARPGLVLAVA